MSEFILSHLFLPLSFPIFPSLLFSLNGSNLQCLICPFQFTPIYFIPYCSLQSITSHALLVSFFPYVPIFFKFCIESIPHPVSPFDPQQLIYLYPFPGMFQFPISLWCLNVSLICLKLTQLIQFDKQDLINSIVKIPL